MSGTSPGDGMLEGRWPLPLICSAYVLLRETDISQILTQVCITPQWWQNTEEEHLLWKPRERTLAEEDG
jgi:hypothetical protein